MVPHIHTTDGITVVLYNKPYHAAKTDAIFDDVVALVNAGEEDKWLLDLFERAATKIKAVTKLTPNMEYSGGVVLYKGDTLANYAVDKLIAIIEAGQNTVPLSRFLDNLLGNPSKRVVDDLYRFLEKGRIPITEDGHFLAYKKVRADYKDIHSGRFVNTVGAKFEMPRNQVDEDASRTCSTGFHVCSYDYLPQFGSSEGNRVVVCKINPADVVAIPADYNDTKMRVYKYEVISEVTDYFKKGENVLAKQEVAEKPYEVVYVTLDDSDDDSFDISHGKYWTEAEAETEAELLVDTGVASESWVNFEGVEIHNFGQ